MSERTDALHADERVRTAVRASVRIVLVVGGAVTAFAARRALLLAFVAVLVAVILSFPVGWLGRVVRRGAAVLLVLVAFGAAIAGIVVVGAPSLSDELTAAAETAPRALREVREWLDQVQRRSAPRAARGAGGRPEAQEKLAERAAEVAVPAVTAVAGTVTEIVLVVVLAAFLVAEPDLYRRGLRRLVPPRQEAVFDELWFRLGAGLRRWVGGILVAMAIMGALTAAGLLAIGIESWALLGFLTFLGTFVPYLGAVASAVPGLLVAFGDSPRALALAAGVYLGVHVVEGYVVEPFVMRRAVQLRPAVLLGGQAVLGAVFGLLGIVIATPALVCAEIAVEYLWVERRLGRPAPPA